MPHHRKTLVAAFVVLCFIFRGKRVQSIQIHHHRTLLSFYCWLPPLSPSRCFSTAPQCTHKKIQHTHHTHLPILIDACVFNDPSCQKNWEPHWTTFQIQTTEYKKRTLDIGVSHIILLLLFTYIKRQCVRVFEIVKCFMCGVSLEPKFVPRSFDVRSLFICVHTYILKFLFT